MPGGYQYLGPGTTLKMRLARGDPGINRLDKVAKTHDIDYSNAELKGKNSKDVHKMKLDADRKMVATIRKFPKKSLTERAVKNIILAKYKLKL